MWKTPASSSQTQGDLTGLGSLATPVFKVNYEGNKHSAVPGPELWLSCSFRDLSSIQGKALNRALAIRSSIPFREAMGLCKAREDVFQAEHGTVFHQVTHYILGRSSG